MGEFNAEIRMFAEFKEKLFTLVEKYNELAINSKREFGEKYKKRYKSGLEIDIVLQSVRFEHEEWQYNVREELEAINITGKGELVYRMATYKHRDEIIHQVTEHLKRLNWFFKENCCGMILSSSEYEAYKNFLTREYMVYTNK